MYLCGCLSACLHAPVLSFFFFNDTATTEIYTLSLHDALPISPSPARPRKASNESTIRRCDRRRWHRRSRDRLGAGPAQPRRSEEHTSELQSPCNLVCRLLLEKKKQPTRSRQNYTPVSLPDSLA